MARSLLWIRQEVERFELDERPVQTILQVSIKTPPELSLHGKAQQDAHAEIIQNLERQFHNLVVGPVHLSFYRNPNAQKAPKHFVSRSGYSDIVKARVMKQFLPRF